jgi:ecotin
MELSMKFAPLFVAGLLITTATGMSFAQSGPDLSPYPEAKAGQKQHVIVLPTEENEEQLKLELIVGKTMEIDCNHHMFGGELDEETAEGWGYNYYVLEDLGNGASTMMGCPDDTKRETFVRSTDQELVRYNSKLPIVVYTPEDVELHYRVWRADAEQIVK